MYPISDVLNGIVSVILDLSIISHILVPFETLSPSDTNIWEITPEIGAFTVKSLTFSIVSLYESRVLSIESSAFSKVSDISSLSSSYNTSPFFTESPTSNVSDKTSPLTEETTSYLSLG